MVSGKVVICFCLFRVSKNIIFFIWFEIICCLCSDVVGKIVFFMNCFEKLMFVSVSLFLGKIGVVVRCFWNCIVRSDCRVWWVNLMVLVV